MGHCLVAHLIPLWALSAPFPFFHPGFLGLFSHPHPHVPCACQGHYPAPSWAGKPNLTMNSKSVFHTNSQIPGEAVEEPQLCCYCTNIPEQPHAQSHSWAVIKSTEREKQAAQFLITAPLLSPSPTVITDLQILPFHSSSFGGTGTLLSISPQLMGSQMHLTGHWMDAPVIKSH